MATKRGPRSKQTDTGRGEARPSKPSITHTSLLIAPSPDTTNTNTAKNSILRLSRQMAKLPRYNDATIEYQ